jgi:hypothetical protein
VLCTVDTEAPPSQQGTTHYKLFLVNLGELLYPVIVFNTAA